MNTKKPNKISLIISAILLLTAFSVSLKAQESHAGIKGGLNLSWLTIEDANDNNIVPGFHGGVYGRLMLSDKLGIQPEILYSMKGVKTVYDEDFLGVDVANGETKLNLNYIDVPVYLTYNLSEDFDFHLGPYVGFLMNAKGSTDTEILSFIDIEDEDGIDREEFNKIDYGLSGGLGFTLDPIILGFNFNLGLNQVADPDGAMNDLLGDATNHSIQVYAGFKF